MTRPLIQIDEDGNSREMTEEEHAYYLEFWASISSATDNIDETPSPD
jgi:hypothetical protein